MDNGTTPLGSTPLFLEDLYIGMSFSSDEHVLDAKQIKAFATQFDPQPFHLDEIAAQDTLFGGLAASGWHTAAITMKLLVTCELRIAGGLIGAGVELSWPTPTRPGDVLRVYSTIIDIIPSRSRPDRAVVVLGNETRNQHGDVLQKMQSKLIVRRRPESKPDDSASV